MLADRTRVAPSLTYLFVLDDCQMEGTALPETEPLIEPNRGIIVKCVQKRSAALGGDVAHDLAHCDAGITSPSRFRMRAHSAHLDKTRHSHALPRHRQQPFGCEDSVEISQFHRSLAKRARFGETCQFQHRRDVGVAEPSQCNALRERARTIQIRLPINHLRKYSATKDAPGFRQRWLVGKEESNQTSRAREPPQRLIACQRLIRCSGQRSDRRRITTSHSIAEREFSMLREQRIQNRTVEKRLAAIGLENFSRGSDIRAGFRGGHV